MTNARMLRQEESGIDVADWAEPAVLDAILLGRRLLRSDAGTVADDQIIVADVSEEDIAHLEDVSAALALQKAVMCVMTSETRRPGMDTICQVVNRIESRGDLHDVLIAAEIFRCRDEPVLAKPPEDLHTYRDGTMTGLMRRALDAMNPKTYGMEALAVACSLCPKTDLLNNVDPTIHIETRPATGESLQPQAYPLAIRNNLAWLAKNPDADEKRTARYLRAYGTTIEKLSARL